MAGAPVGNRNSANGKRWTEAIKRALARLSRDSVETGLDRLADKLVAMAAEGDTWAIAEVGNRMEGKPAQALTISGDEDNPLAVKQVGIVDLVRPDPV